MDADASLNQLTHTPFSSFRSETRQLGDKELPLDVHFMHITYKYNVSPECLLT
jgi:hypothetical protein